MTTDNRRWAIAARAAAVAALAVVVLGGGAAAWAQQAPDPAARCTRPRGMLTPEDRAAMGQIFMRRLQGQVGLSDQQAQDVQQILRGARDASQSDRQALCMAHVALRQLLNQQNSDPAAVKAAGEQVKTLMGQLHDRRLDTVLALRAKLTPEQWAKWVELRKGRRGHWRGHQGWAS